MTKVAKLGNFKRIMDEALEENHKAQETNVKAYIKSALARMGQGESLKTRISAELEAQSVAIEDGTFNYCTAQAKLNGIF